MNGQSSQSDHNSSLSLSLSLSLPGLLTPSIPPSAIVPAGGHLELQAISTALDVCIEVYSAENPVLKIGEEKEGAPLRLSYHLHAYGLGEHYNSVRPIQT